MGDPCAPSETIRTTCPYCGVGCGVCAEVDAAGGVAIAGDPDHPANRGKLCSKGTALADTLGLEQRLLQPEVRGRQTDWDTALDAVADGFRGIIDAHGPEAVALYVSGQLLTEDYYVANKLVKGYLGTGNIDTNSRLCMSSAVAGHQRAFGGDTVPGCYEDLELADLVVLVGSNTAWCHPIVYRRLAAAKAERPDLTVVAIDPRRTATCDIADLHLPIRAGTDVDLFNGLLAFLDNAGCIDRDFVGDHTAGAEDAVAAARAGDTDLAALARACAVPEKDLAAFFRLFVDREKTVTLFSQGVNQSSAGTDKVNAIINCHLYTGRIGKPGMGPFSITGQPNAMGGREVGGLASTLAAHMDFDQAARVQRFWDSPVIADAPGLKAVDLFEAIGEGRIKAVWIIATNPVISLPDADAAREALRQCELVVASDCMAATDTVECADIKLPAQAWAEKDGTVTNSERTIARQRAFLPAPGEARADWRIICDVAQRLGFSGFDYPHPVEIFTEHARLSAFENGGSRAFDIGALARLDAAAYDALEPIQWPLTAGPRTSSDRGVQQASRKTPRRLFANGVFPTADGRARLVAVSARPPENAPDANYPLVLNTGRVRDHWHTMTRTGKSARLSNHVSEPFVGVHPQDAQVSGIADGGLATLATAWGRMTARVTVDEGQRRGAVFAPIHWTRQYASAGRVGALVNPARDPLSGEPEFKHTPVRVTPFEAGWYGFLLAREGLDIAHAPGPEYWVRIKGERFWRYELAGRDAPGDWAPWARRVLGAPGPAADWL
ncbi:MAG: nitrate reductase [Halofilum sp. (in: g-proteobacteria)]